MYITRVAGWKETLAPLGQSAGTLASQINPASRSRATERGIGTCFEGQAPHCDPNRAPRQLRESASNCLVP